MESKDVDRFRLRFMNNITKLTEEEAETNRLIAKINENIRKHTTITKEWENEGYGEGKI